ncbi:MAG: hypothetical protein BWY31_00557 [Lentisphaerae bacterium ADurb.Bin242]|nr:MAG: hypothetical protein BWY31_00557 [Lentisphaerae bacterium ADurb.Bin242]
MKKIASAALFAFALFTATACLNAQEAEKPSWGRIAADKALMYIPNRIVELFDIFSLELESGVTVKCGVRLTHAFGFGAGIGPSGKLSKDFNRTYGTSLNNGYQAYFLALGIGDETREYTYGNLPPYWYQYEGVQLPTDRIFAVEKVKDYWALEAGAAFLVGAKAAIHPLNIADFLCGIFCYDLLGNDYNLIID